MPAGTAEMITSGSATEVASGIGLYERENMYVVLVTEFRRGTIREQHDMYTSSNAASSEAAVFEYAEVLATRSGAPRRSAPRLDATPPPRRDRTTYRRVDPWVASGRLESPSTKGAAQALEGCALPLTRCGLSHRTSRA